MTLVKSPSTAGLDPSVISQGRSRAAQRSLYYGTTEHLTAGAQLAAAAVADPELEVMRTVPMRRGVSALPVAWSVRDATVIAAIRLERELKANSRLPLRVYRVQGEPFHAVPLAVSQELRLRSRGSRKALIVEYWKPSGVWHLWEALVFSLVLIEELAPASGLDTYVPRVLYGEDAKRARML